MNFRGRRAPIRAALVSALLAVTPLAITTAPAAAAVALRCSAAAPLFAVDDNVRYIEHQDPETGKALESDSPVIGNGGWAQFSRVIAGPNGVIWAFRPNGELLRYIWTGDGWSDNSGEVLDNDWAGWDQPQYRNRIAVDERGDIYSAGAGGVLIWRRYDDATHTWTKKVIDSSSFWGQYDLLVASGDGVLFGRRPDGNLDRARYNAPSQRWLQETIRVGNGGWDDYKSITSAGGDVLYVATWGGDLRWYRYQEDSNSWTANSPSTIGFGGWSDFTDLVATSNACKLQKNFTPPNAPVTVRTHARTALLQSATGALEYSYVDASGALVVGSQPNLGADITLRALDGPPVNGTPSLAEANGTVQVITQGRDSVVRATTVKPDGTPLGAAELGGGFSSPATVGNTGPNTLALLAVNAADGKLLCRVTGDGGFLPWRRQQTGTVPFGAEAPVYLTDGATKKALLRNRDGVYYSTADSSCGGSTPTASLGGPATLGAATAVLNADHTMQAYAVGADGVVYTQKQLPGDSWPQLWTALPALSGAKAVGQPSAVLTPGGIEVVVRDDQNHVQSTGQTADGGYRPWVSVDPDHFVATATDPTLALVQAGATKTLAFVYRDADDFVYLYSSTPAAAAKAASPGFTVKKLGKAVKG
ncbi:tachylectin-related carbohydrate-binding protein [Amycolatopsis sp. NPDC059657]|uniref:tachylectin-related carbohydrate-binding protein n=1 Tax=Amycolatopsis sp. NPDC059657 TaxID=3346899 RepID=UPI0036720977